MATPGTPWGWLLGPLLLSVTGCHGSGPGGHIVHGEDCSPHSQPWQAALFLEEDFFCGGVLVHPQWVLSAAHCFQNSFTVGLGLHSLDASQEAGSLLLETTLSIRHPKFNKPYLANDLMLVRLPEPVTPSATIQAIGIASRCPLAGESCTISGWGRLQDGEPPRVLQCANISVVSEKVCTSRYSQVYHPSMFCAGGGDPPRDSCYGDSGGPLVCNGSLQGLVSFGQAQCGLPGMPAVYTNLCKFSDWIQKTILTS
ncbi:kallikrein-4 [Suncus etruscus]|uniref:kallikrein-4 n=1 Tax=Suncus etruscus TaxID=109475 RepID=UPI00210F44DD|nr:kallikrein-4 [Suncus etruscus]